MPELRIDRHFDAPPARVFDFVTTGAGLLSWWVPEGMTAREHSLDFSRPGPWRMVVTAPGMGETTMGGDVLSVDAPRIVELSFVVSYPGMAPVDSVVRFELAPEDGGTRFTIVQTGITQDMVMLGLTRGWPPTLDRLQRALAA